MNKLFLILIALFSFTSCSNSSGGDSKPAGGGGEKAIQHDLKNCSDYSGNYYIDDKMPNCSGSICESGPAVFGSIETKMNQFDFQFKIVRDESNTNSTEIYVVDGKVHDFKYGYRYVSICTPKKEVEIMIFKGEQLTSQNAMINRFFSIDLNGNVSELDICMNDNLCDKSKNVQVTHQRR